MKLFKLFFLLLALSLFIFSCRKNNCTSSNLVKTDELTNTVWFGSYRDTALMRTDPDTLFIFSMRPEGFINAYSAKGFYQNLDSLIQIYKDLANRIPDGKGFYSFDGVHFHTQVTFDRVGHSYILNGSVITENKTEISGDFNFNSNNRYGIFFIHPIEMWVK